MRDLLEMIARRIKIATDAEISRALFAFVAPVCAFGIGFYLPFGIL